MSVITITPFKILVCLIFATLSAVAFRFAMGSKRDLHFKRSSPKSILTLRGKLGEYLALGYPKTLTGAAICLCLTAFIAAGCFVILTVME